MLDMIPMPNSKENAKRAFPMTPFKLIDFISNLPEAATPTTIVP